MTTLREAAEAVATIPADVLAQFDAVFRPVALDPRKVTMESALSAMRPTVIPKENE